jgi:hemin uptake protein HemP
MTEAKKPLPHAARQPVRRIEVKELLGGAREAVLLHAREEYRLRLTSNGKLILTK